MSDLFKLTFIPMFDNKENISKYKVNVEYFNKSIVGARFDMRNDKKLGYTVYFTKDSIDVIDTYLEAYDGESYAIKSLLGNNYLIEKKCLQTYIDSIEHIKPQLEKFCMEKQKEEDCEKKVFKEWQQKKPIEYSF